MLHKNKTSFSDKELNSLLSIAFLNLDFNQSNNQKMMETIANEAMQPMPVNTTLYTKSFFVKLIGLTVVLITAVNIYLYFNTSKKSIIETPQINKNISEHINSNNKQLNIKDDSVKYENNEKPLINSAKITFAEIKSQFKIPEKPFIEGNKMRQETYTITNNVKKADDTSYVFPTLTDEEIKKTIKQKVKMQNWLSKQSKEKFALIVPNGAHSLFSALEDTTAMFFIQNTEVSNLEYRTFLLDLLIQNRKDEFLIAKPNQRLWLNTLGKTRYNYLKNSYFSDKKFDDYPVVNISPKAAELYCQWLSDFKRNEKEFIVARLPYENEWEFAARGNSKTAYPWKTESIQNIKGCYLTNFCIKKRATELKQEIDCRAKNPNYAYNSADYMLGDTVLTSYIYSYNPNDFGLYCMSGNVAEMVYDNKTKTIKTKGGSWDSDFEQCKIWAVNDEIAKASSTSGFRPMFRIAFPKYFGANERDALKTGLTSEEKQKFSKEKQKMIEAFIKKSKADYALIPMGSCLYKNDTVSVQAYFMQTTEVSNLQYRTFLADLIIQNKTQEYQNALPNQEAWNLKFFNMFNEPLRNMYFSHPAYDEYPVVTISRQAAQMYCNWLSIETILYAKDHNMPLINDIRLPTEYEWALAASSTFNKTKYANGFNYLKDLKGNFKINFLSIKKEHCKFDSVYKMYLPNYHKNKSDKKDEIFLGDDGAFHTAHNRAYTPNTYGIYNLAGNVSEMVIEHKTNKPITKGGSWYSCDYFLEIDADDEFGYTTEASPMIGFRVVTTALKK